MYPKEYIDFLVHFHGDRDYFECHEILEEYWKSVDKGNKESFLVGLILLAVSNYHHRRGNFNGALRTLQKAIGIFNKQEGHLSLYGFSAQEFFDVLHKRQKGIKNTEEYVSMNLPLEDNELLKVCKKRCEEKGFVWGQESNLLDENMVHRHSRRDRSDVIRERNQAIKSRQRKGRE